jgi:hypothetical protein
MNLVTRNLLCTDRKIIFFCTNTVLQNTHHLLQGMAIWKRMVYEVGQLYYQVEI